MRSEKGTKETPASPTTESSRQIPEGRARKQEKQEPEIDESAAKAADREMEKEVWEGVDGVEREQTVSH